MVLLVLARLPQQLPEMVNQRQYGAQWPLTAATHQGRINIVHALLNKGAEVNPSTECIDVMCLSPLNQAIQAKQLSIFQLLLEQGANVNECIEYDEDEYQLKRFSQSFWNVRKHNVLEIIDSTFPIMPIPNKQCPLSMAIYYDQHEMVKRLFQHPDIDLDLAKECVSELKSAGFSFSPETEWVVKSLLDGQISNNTHNFHKSK